MQLDLNILQMSMTPKFICKVKATQPKSQLLLLL